MEPPCDDTLWVKKKKEVSMDVVIEIKVAALRGDHDTEVPCVYHYYIIVIILLSLCCMCCRADNCCSCSYTFGTSLYMCIASHNGKSLCEREG